MQIKMKRNLLKFKYGHSEKPMKLYEDQPCPTPTIRRCGLWTG